jgi:UDP-N-acetylmuramate: L-alanyl-gamma-D-glutamyl-meso-diaminopimelate ligase
LKLHILGIAGTFMGGVAALARELGHEVEGSDQNIYPPMSTQLERLGIALRQGYAADNISADCDEIVVGNALSRGNAAVEQVLDDGRRYNSGAQWLAENVLPGRDTLAVAGTHGKTTTTTILTWLLEAAGRSPGFLIGGVAEDFGVSARLGGHRAPPSSAPSGHLLPPAGEGESVRPAAAASRVGREFVVEADEYDTAFFDKRSKFVHYRPLVAILNNLEYDHADIFPDVAAIQRQFHHLVRTVPRRGRLIVNGEDNYLAEVLAMGCWTPVETFGLDASLAPSSTQPSLHGDRADEGAAARAAFNWTARLVNEDGSAFVVVHDGRELGEVRWPLLGRHNVMNALASLAAAHAVGVDVKSVLPALAEFRSVKRRLEVIGEARDVTIYDDFAHHPTAIATTLAGLRAKVGGARIVVAMEPRSNSMRLGAHAEALAPSLDIADAVVFLHRPELAWDAGKVVAGLRGEGTAVPDVDRLIAVLRERVRAGDHVVFMSNGGFDGAPRRFLAALREQ